MVCTSNKALRTSFMLPSFNCTLGGDGIFDHCFTLLALIIL